MPYAIAYGDFAEQYQLHDSNEIVDNNVWRTAILAMQDKYKKEFDSHRVVHLILEKER